METAYDIILSLSEEELAGVHCNLDKHIVYYKSKIIFDGHCFCNMQNAAMLNELPLIKIVKGDWTKDIVNLYVSYSLSYPKHCRYSNFIHSRLSEEDFLFAPDNYHSTRVALELFIIFHCTLKDITWPYGRHFMHKVCEDCIIKRNWLT